MEDVTPPPRGRAVPRRFGCDRSPSPGRVARGRHRSRSRSRTPPRERGARVLKRLCKSRGPGLLPEDALLGRLPTYRLLDVEQCLREFCPGAADAADDVIINLAVLGSGPGDEVESVCQHFGRNVRTALAIDAADWSSHVKPPLGFRRLDVRASHAEVVRMLCDEELFPAEARLLVVASSVASDALAGPTAGRAELLEAYLAELPAHADLLLLEPFSSTSSAGDDAAGAFGNAVCRAAVAAGWPGFMYRGGPRGRAHFLSRSEVPGLVASAAG